MSESVTFYCLPYVSKKLRTALLPVPVADPPDPANGFPPAALWSRLEGEEEPVPVWLLTPALLTTIRNDGDRIDARILAGKIPADKAGEIVARYEQVMRYARDAAAADWWYCGSARDDPPPEEPPRPFDFDEVAGMASAAELADAHNAVARERWLRKAHKRAGKAAEGENGRRAGPGTRGGLAAGGRPCRGLRRCGNRRRRRACLPGKRNPERRT
jgi:hypothetical protein